LAEEKKQSDEELYLLCAQGDKEAFRKLVIQYQDMVVGYFVRRLGDVALSEDLAQEVLVKLWKHADRYTVRAKFSTYLYSVAHNALIDYIRREDSRVDTVSGADEEGGNIIAESVGAGLPEPLERLEREEQTALIMKKIQELKKGEREVVLLVLAQGLSYKEAADTLSIPEGTVKSRLHAALSRLRVMLNIPDAGNDNG